MFQAAWTDWAFRVPSLRLLEARNRAGGAGRSYAYEFTWPSPVPGLGATHDLDHGFVFDHLPRVVAAFGDALGPLNPLGDSPPQSLADAMHGAFVRFATDGDPGWAPYDLERRVTMRFDEDSGPVDNLAGAELAMWEGLR